MTQTEQPVETPLPRWTVAGARDSGAGEQEVAVPGDLAEALSTRPDGPRPALLAAHLAVLTRVCGERDVTTGLVTKPSGHVLRCSATVHDGRWRDLVDKAAAVLDAGTPAAGPHETMLDLSEEDGPWPDAFLAVRWLLSGSPRLVLRYRHDAMTAEHAARIAGYYLAALRLIAEDPSADHRARTLLSEQELAVQRYALAGPRRPLPPRLFVEQFAEQVRRHGGETAAVHGDLSWTYAELDVRARRVRDGLLEAGLRPEDTVAACFGRTLDWLAATLGIMQAGGVYVPVRPDFPAERVAAQLNGSACRFAVTDDGSAAALDRAAPLLERDFTRLLVGDLKESVGDRPGPDIGPGQLAYVYFTSGSTGAPKGAMCEHAGMLNHLYAKVEDLGLGPGDRVAQTASQCFDISLWQLLAPLLAGGSTEIVDTEVQLDVAQFVELLARGGINVVQIVPSYLDVMLSYLERHPVNLGDLHAISVTGEALKLELVRRWFRVQPGIRLVNAYGATEVSDDTMHEILDRVPDRDFVTVGRSLRNVTTWILDEEGQPAPLGSPGQIAFSGVCLGRGYVRDPGRTAEAFVTDPFDPDVPMYLTGDYGRWLPEGKIEFLGRRDQQVKIRGYRIELGEVENTLLRVPGVREAAVVITGRSDQAALVAFHTGIAAVDPIGMLEGWLPEYMVPRLVHRLDALPLTENGKVDKRALTGLADSLGQPASEQQAPATATERRLATAWAEVLNVLVERIGRTDDFFELGGTSLAAVRLVVALDRLVSLRQLGDHPVLADLAAQIDAAGARPEAGGAGGGTRLVQRLSTIPDTPAATLVCAPYAGGNAVNFRGLATELRADGIEVRAIEPPGHDVAWPDEPLAEATEIAGRVRSELADVEGPLLLWGHCAGAAVVLETARLLEEAGRPVDRVLFGGVLLEPPEVLRAEVEGLSAVDDRTLLARLREDSTYIELDAFKAERSGLTGAAYRHDTASANRYLADLQAAPDRHRLRAPVEVVVAADDPTTRDARTRHRWDMVADPVRVHELPEGGHHFVRTRPADVAAVVRDAVAAPVPTA